MRYQNIFPGPPKLSVYLHYCPFTICLFTLFALYYPRISPPLPATTRLPTQFLLCRSYISHYVPILFAQLLYFPLPEVSLLYSPDTIRLATQIPLYGLYI